MTSVGVGADEIDLKRAGIFSIVHGIRTLSIDKGILAGSTATRIEALVEAGTLKRDFGQELSGALHAFMEFRLRAQLDALRRGTMERESVMRLDDLTTTDRDILRDALRIVRQFREMIRSRYHLGAF
jgi:CBS domain-containing protein